MKIYNLAEIPSAEFEAVGGKAKGLFQLSQAQLPIAPGFVVTDIDNESDVEQATAHYLDMELGAVAVRSSANAEDGVEFSNAGQYETFLNVSGKESFKEALVACLLSLDSSGAAGYSSFFNQAKSTKMAVVVQQMVDAAKAGVCFSEDPTGEKENILIESVDGLGEDLVSGLKSAEQYTINRQQIDDPDVRPESILSAKELHQICSGAVEAARHLDMPVDLEWAIDKAGELFWLQCRPITTSDNGDIHELDTALDWGESAITNCNIGEMLPGAVTPLTISTTVYAIDYGLRRMLASAGVYKKAEDVPPYHCALNVGNHLFLNLSTIYQLGDYVFGTDKDSVELSICGRILEDKPAGCYLPVRKTGALRKMINGGKYVRFLMSRNKARKKLAELAREYKFTPRQTIGQQFEAIDKDIHLITEALSLHYVTSAHSGAMSSALFMILNGKIDDAEKTRSIIASLLENIDEIESVDILRSLRKIARALHDEQIDSQTMTDSELLDYLNTSGSVSNIKYLEFINKHGHRAIREAEMMSKGWAQDDAGFVAYLRTVMGSIDNMRTKENDTSHLSALGELKGQFSDSKMRAISYFAKQSRTGVVNRESSKSSSIRIINEFKIAYDHLGQMMAQAAVLPDPTLIYFLTHEEIGLLATNDETPLVKKALQRKRLFEEQKALRFKDVYFGKPHPEEFSLDDIGADDALKGTPVSRGVARGRVRIVKSIEDANKLQKGEIMVASFTDIGWSPYYCVIEALVTEIGSALSHGAVVAREYSLPLITNVIHATSRLKDGDIITVNANLGVIIKEETA